MDRAALTSLPSKAIMDLGLRIVMTGYRDLDKLIKPVFPRLFGKIKTEIETREENYSREGHGQADSFLWEHTLHTALYTRKICILENRDPLIPVIAALFHDIGKFEGSHYHKTRIPEEESSSKIASEFLCLEGADPSDIRDIVSGLRSLYDENSRESPLGSILHDADFLAKSGTLGVASFFTKAALRGQNLIRTLSFHLSKELTYASVLPLNMKTPAGRTLAKLRSKESISFFRKLVQELADAGIAEFVITEHQLPCPQNEGKKMVVTLAVPSRCPSCSGELEKNFVFEQGIKCTELVVYNTCSCCEHDFRISFCLPELLS